jgi:hypothetical protein
VHVYAYCILAQLFSLYFCPAAAQLLTLWRLSAYDLTAEYTIDLFSYDCLGCLLSTADLTAGILCITAYLLECYLAVDIAAAAYLAADFAQILTITADYTAA